MTSPADLKELAPTGQLRGGVVAAPAASAFFATREGKGEVRGVTVDLIRSFAAALKLPLALQIYDNSGQVTEAVASGDCDVAFMPQDAERAKRVDFGPAYYFIESTYLVPAGSTIRTIDEVNRPGRRIVAISNTTTARSARRTAPQASVEEVPSVDQMTEMARRGRVMPSLCRIIHSQGFSRSFRALACCREIFSRPASPLRSLKVDRLPSGLPASCCWSQKPQAWCAARSMLQASRKLSSHPSASLISEHKNDIADAAALDGFVRRRGLCQ